MPQERITDHRSPAERDATLAFVVFVSTLPRERGLAYLAVAVRNSLDSRNVCAQAAKITSWTGGVFQNHPPTLNPADELVVIGWERWPEWYRDGVQLNRTTGARKPFGFEHETRKAAAR